MVLKMTFTVVGPQYPVNPILLTGHLNSHGVVLLISSHCYLRLRLICLMLAYMHPEWIVSIEP